MGTICPNCMMLIDSTDHVCGVAPSNPAITYGRDNPSDLDRLCAAVERIADALEKKPYVRHTKSPYDCGSR